MFPYKTNFLASSLVIIFVVAPADSYEPVHGGVVPLHVIPSTQHDPHSS